MQTHFDQDLEKLRNRIIKMGNLAIQQTAAAMKILLQGDTEQLEAAERNEYEIDKLDVKVDILCQRIFALQQPVATDLRFIMSSLRIGNELERVGDISMGIVNKSEIVREQPEILIKFNIKDIASATCNLIQKTFQLYTVYESEKIDEVKAECHNLKERCRTIFDSIIVEMTQKSEVIIVATNLILILRQIERIADHASNMAESIYFMNEGAIIKHGKMEVNKILILNASNSCISQMAEGILKSFNKNFEIFSAGTEPAEEINPYAIKVMLEIGIDISMNKPKNVNEFLDKEFNYVITLCNKAKETCPEFTGKVKKYIHVEFDNPCKESGTEEEILNAFRKIRDQIKVEFFKFNAII